MLSKKVNVIREASVINWSECEMNAITCDWIFWEKWMLSQKVKVIGLWMFSVSKKKLHFCLRKPWKEELRNKFNRTWISTWHLNQIWNKNYLESVCFFRKVHVCIITKYFVSQHNLRSPIQAEIQDRQCQQKQNEKRNFFCKQFTRVRRVLNHHKLDVWF